MERVFTLAWEQPAVVVTRPEQSNVLADHLDQLIGRVYRAFAAVFWGPDLDLFGVGALHLS